MSNDFPPRVGGINYYVDQIFRRFGEGEVVVVAPADDGAEEFDASWPHPVERWSGRTLVPEPRLLRFLVDVARRHRPDIVVFGALAPFGLLGPPLERLTGVPYGGFSHGVELSATRVPGSRLPMRFIGRGARFITAVSRWTMGELRPYFGEGPRYELLPAGIDEVEFRPGLDTGHLRDRYQLDGRPVISCVSRLVERKGQDRLIDALPAVQREIPGAQLLIVGGGSYEAELRAMAAASPSSADITFAGEVPYTELAAHFAVGDVVAVPCRHRLLGLEVEALGAVFLQAAAVGRPSLGGRVGGVPDALLHGRTGLLVDPHDTTAVADGLISLLSDPARAARMGEFGAEWVHRDLTWDAIADRLAKLLAEVGVAGGVGGGAPSGVAG